MSEFVLAVLLATAASLLTVPIFTLLLEVLSAIKSSPDQLESTRKPTNSGATAIVVPAHNEGVGLLPTLSDLRPQLANNDRLIVVADNCSDETASLARREGVEVIERTDPAHIGKGYALAEAIAYLDRAPPDLVLFVELIVEYNVIWSLG